MTCKSLKKALPVAAIALVAAVAATVLWTPSAGPARAQGLTGIMTYQEAQAIAAGCYTVKTVTVRLPDGTETERKLLPHDTINISESNETPYSCSMDQLGAAVGSSWSIAHSHMVEVWGDVYLREGYPALAIKFYTQASSTMRGAINFIPLIVEEAADQVELAAMVGESLTRVADKLDTALGAGGPAEVLANGRAVLLNRIANADRVSDDLIASIEAQIDREFAAGDLGQVVNDVLVLARALAIKGETGSALDVIVDVADRLGGSAGAHRLYMQASDLASRSRQCGLAEEMWRQAQAVDSSIGGYIEWPSCRGLTDEPVLSPAGDAAGRFNESSVTGCVNNHRNSSDPRRNSASADVQRAQCLIRESAFLDLDDALVVLRTARELSSEDIVLGAVAYETAGDRYGRAARHLEAMAAYQAAAEHTLTTDAAGFANSIHQYGGTASLKELVAPVAQYRQAAAYYRSAAAVAFQGGASQRRALMLELAGEVLRLQAKDLQRPAGYSDEDFDRLRLDLITGARNDLYLAARVYQEEALDYERAAELFLLALELDTWMLPVQARLGQSSLSLFSLAAFQQTLESSPEGAVNVNSRLGEAQLVAISFAATPDALQPGIARQARRLFDSLARVAQRTLSDHIWAEDLFGRAGDAVIRPVAVEADDWGNARVAYVSAGQAAEQYGSCVRATEWYQKAAEAQRNTSPNATALTCSRDSLKYGEGVPLSLVEELDALGEVIGEAGGSTVQPEDPAGPSTPNVPDSSNGGSASDQEPEDAGPTIEDQIVEELSPPSQGGGGCSASSDGTVSAGHLGMLAVPLGLAALRLWRRG